jgi:uncharacterized protein YejL (UPF0352 family)
VRMSYKVVSSSVTAADRRLIAGVFARNLRR